MKRKQSSPGGWPCPDGHGPMLGLPDGQNYCPHPDHEPRGTEKGSRYIFSDDELREARTK